MMRLLRTKQKARGQALTESSLILFSLAVGAVSALFALEKFQPDAMSAFTIYIRGFYLILSLPIG
jgi:uncharacterized membrane protein YoaK (UPF0700 family)